MKLIEVWSGGQTGADIAGLRAAKAVGLRTGGFIPKGFRTLAGPRPEYAELYGLKETPSSDYGQRTLLNVQSCDATLLIGNNVESSGYRLTLRHCRSLCRPLHETRVWRPKDIEFKAGVVIEWLRKHNISRLNVAGNRDADEGAVQAFLDVVLYTVVQMQVEVAER